MNPIEMPESSARFEPPAPPPVKVLFVDDEPNILRSLRRLFRKEPWEKAFAESGAEALELFERDGPFDVVVSDQRMPGMQGSELLSKVRNLHPDSIRIVLSGYAEVQTILDAVNEGSIYKFLTKPWEDEILRETVAGAVEVAGLRSRCDGLLEVLEAQNAELFRTTQILQEALLAESGVSGGVVAPGLLLDAQPVGVVVFDDGGRVQYLNPAAQALLGDRADGQWVRNALADPGAEPIPGVIVRSEPKLALRGGSTVSALFLWET